MTDSKKSGIALLAGSIGSIVTMAVHPTGAPSMNPQDLHHLALMSAVAHTLAIVSCTALFLGACGLALRLRAADRIAFAALVVYAVAAISILIATAVSGFIVPGLMVRMAHDDAAAGPMWRIGIVSIFAINQAFAAIYAVGASVAMGMWSWAALRNGGLRRGLAIYGAVLAPLLAGGIAVGHLRMDVHGMALVVVLQGIWYIGAAVEMVREEPLVTAQPA